MHRETVLATARKTDRLEAFSDAVLAITITLPVIELKAPEVGANGDLYRELMKLWPQYLSYALSFVVIGIYWARSHFLGKILEKTDHPYNLLNLLFLASVSVIPFPTRAFVNHIEGDGNSTTASAVYAASLAVPSVLWTVKWFYAARLGLLDPRVTREYLHRGKIIHLTTSVGFILATALVFTTWRIGIAIAGCLTFAYLWPPLPDYTPGQEPKNELEEAEDRPR